MNSWIWVAVAALTATPAAANTYHYTARAINSVDGKQEESRLEGWMDGTSRYWLVRQAGGRTLITLGVGSDVWYLNPATQIALHNKQSPKAMAKLAALTRVVGDDVAAYTRQGGKKRAVETVGGVRCDVYAATLPEGTARTLWVQQGPDRLTKRYQVVTRERFAAVPGEPMKEHLVTRTVTYNWDIGKPVKASLFRVPAGYKVQEGNAGGLLAYRPPAGPVPPAIARGKAARRHTK